MDNEVSYKSIWPEIKKIIEKQKKDLITKYISDFDVILMATKVLDFNDDDFLKSRKKRDMLRDTIIHLQYELSQIKKENDSLKSKNMGVGFSYDKIILENTDLINTVYDQNEKIKDDRLQISNLSNRLREKENQVILLNEKLKKQEEEKAKLENSQKIHSGSYIYYKNKYQRLQKKLNDYMSGKNENKSESTKDSDNSKNIVFSNNTNSSTQETSDFYFVSISDFRFQMERLEQFKKLEYPNLFKKLIICIWDHRENEVFTKKDLRKNYDFGIVSKMPLERYLKIFLELGIIKKIGKGFYQVLF